MKRRDFLKLSAAALPALMIPGRARAATAATGKAKHLLLLYAKGGLRSHCLFNAVGGARHNPWGAQEHGAEWALGAVCGSDDIATSAGPIDGFKKRTRNVAVLASIDHAPRGEVDVDHRTASNRIGTGAPEGTAGLLTLIGQHHPQYAGGFTLSAVPPVEIGASEFGFGGGETSRYRPLSLLGADEGFESTATIEKSWSLGARAKLDARFLAAKAPAYRTRLEGFLLAKKNALTFSDLLRDPKLDVINSPDAIESGVSNRELIEVLGSGPIPGDTEELGSWGPRVAMALRFFGFGSPACVVTFDAYDMHDDESADLPPRSRDLVRQLAGLDHLLRRMPHPSGGSFWDVTMVAVVSEFSRNNTLAGGFNSGNGSDHVEEEPGPCRNQAIAVMGGPVRAGGKLIGSADSEMNATGTVFSSRSLLSTFLDVLGMDHTPFWPDRPIEELFA